MYQKILVIVLTAMFLVPTVVAVQEDAGIIPGSILYALDLVYEKFEVFMAREPLKKADVYMQQANERLAELSSISGSGEVQYQDLTFERYKARLFNAKLQIDEAASLEQDTSEVTQKLKDTIQANKPVLDNILEGVKLEVAEQLAEADAAAEEKVKELDPVDLLSDAARAKLEAAEAAAPETAEETPEENSEPEVVEENSEEVPEPEAEPETVEETPAEEEITAEETVEEEVPEPEVIAETAEEETPVEETTPELQVPRTGSGWH